MRGNEVGQVGVVMETPVAGLLCVGFLKEQVSGGWGVGDLGAV